MVSNVYKWKEILVIASAHKKFDVWNEVAFTAEISMWATQSWFMGQPKLDMLDLI